MIATKAVNVKLTKCLAPEAKHQISPELPNGKVLYTWNKTAWLVSSEGESISEVRSSNVLTSISYNGSNLVAIGDIKGNIKFYRFDSNKIICDRPIFEYQALNTDIQSLHFCSREILAIGGGMANTSARQFMSIVRVDESSKEVKHLCDGAGGPTKPVNDITHSKDVVAFASDDHSVTLFTLTEKEAAFFKSFNDYGGFIGRVVLSEDASLVAYGSGGSNGKYFIRKICSDEPSVTQYFDSESEKLYFAMGELKSATYSNKTNGSHGVIKTVISKANTLQAFDNIGTLVYTMNFEGAVGSSETTNKQYIAKSIGRRIIVQCRESGEMVKTSGWTSHDSNITSLVFMDTDKLVSVGLDGHIYVWDVAVPLRPIASFLNAHHGPISSVAFSVKNEIVTFGQEDGSIRFFKLE